MDSRLGGAPAAARTPEPWCKGLRRRHWPRSDRRGCTDHLPPTPAAWRRLAGGAALARAATAPGSAGPWPLPEPPAQAPVEAEPPRPDPAAGEGDAVAVELITRAGRLVEETVATIINFFDLSLLPLGGSLASERDLLLAAVRETEYRRSLPLATREPADRDPARAGRPG